MTPTSGAAAERMHRRPQRERPPGEGGFTIVEMLVAMLLMGLVGLTLVRFQTFQMAGAGQVATAALARMEADNRAIDLSVQQRAIDGPVTGTSDNGGVNLYWTATPMPPPEGDLFTELVRIEVAVALEPGGPPAAVRAILRPRELPRDAA